MRMILESFTPVKLNKREAEIIILEEGPGNKGRNCYYGKEAIESGGPIFRGCQVYADHPSKSEQEDLPERSVRDLIGRIKETWVDVNPKTGLSQLRGKLKINEGKSFDWVVSLVKESVKAQEEGFPPTAQVSIHADGDLSPRTINGHQYNYVTKIKSAVSVDVVTKGGIKNSGFINFMESITGGKSQMTNEERFRLLQTKLAESMTDDDASFLENYLQEAEGTGEEYEGAAVGEPDNIFEDEEGNLFAATGEVDDNGDPMFETEDGELVVFPEGDIEESDMEFGTEDGDEEYEDPTMRFDGAEDDDIPISEVAHRFPQLAHEVDQEEQYNMESDRDPDIVALKLENKLLKSRMIAESKLSESGLPEGIVQMAELVGKSPSEMDSIIIARSKMLEAAASMVQGSMAGITDMSLRESGFDGQVGRRLLQHGIIPSAF